MIRPSELRSSAFTNNGTLAQKKLYRSGLVSYQRRRLFELVALLHRTDYSLLAGDLAKYLETYTEPTSCCDE